MISPPSRALAAHITPVPTPAAPSPGRARWAWRRPRAYHGRPSRPVAARFVAWLEFRLAALRLDRAVTARLAEAILLLHRPAVRQLIDPRRASRDARAVRKVSACPRPRRSSRSAMRRRPRRDRSFDVAVSGLVCSTPGPRPEQALAEMARARAPAAGNGAHVGLRVRVCVHVPVLGCANALDPDALAWWTRGAAS